MVCRGSPPDRNARRADTGFGAATGSRWFSTVQAGPRRSGLAVTARAICSAAERRRARVACCSMGRQVLKGPRRDAYMGMVGYDRLANRGVFCCGPVPADACPDQGQDPRGGGTCRPGPPQTSTGVPLAIRSRIHRPLAGGLDPRAADCSGSGPRDRGRPISPRDVNLRPGRLRQFVLVEDVVDTGRSPERRSP